MFEHIVLRRANDDLPVSAGQVAEALLYYRKLHLFIDRATLFNLIKQIGPDLILVVLRRPEVTAVYCEELLGTRTDSIGVSQRHDFVSMRLAGDKDVGELKDPKARLQHELVRQGMKSTTAKQFVKRFFSLVPMKPISGEIYLKGGVVAAAKRDLLDTNYAKAAIRRAVTLVPGGYDIGEALEFNVVDTSGGVFVFTNVDFDRINLTRSTLSTPLEQITLAHLLTKILDARADIALASYYGGDFVTSEATSAIVQVRHAELMRRASLNLEERSRFVEIVLSGAPTLGEVIDSGQRSFREFLDFLDRSDRFKSWMGQVNPDEGLITTYIKDVSAKGWIESLEGKTLRYLMTSVLGAISPVVSIVSGIADAFLIDKLAQGWRPNHFIDNRYAPFVGKT